ncbi:MAG: ABC transporter ATP-binding protein [Bacteroidia bacterium]|nr:MAG: ABC transporter ATP-binding protein [Bacteroidia bacterium]
MIALTNFSFDFGGRRLYDNAQFHIKEGEKVALVGKNGTGKSTFLKILAGEYSLTEGSYSKPKNLKIGFLNQDLASLHFEQSIYEVALSAFESALQLQKEIETLYEQLEKNYSDELFMQLENKQMAFEAAGGKTMKQETRQMLAGLGFPEEIQNKPYYTFSGGWRMRVLLTKILLQKPDLLLLDEPTNHLDLPSVQWLEQYLIQFPSAFIIVSHDRYFLEKTTKRTVEIAFQKLNDYAGNYSFYLKEKAEREKIQQAAYENQQEFIKQQEKFIEKFKAKASKASQAQSKIKQLEKLERIQAVEKDTKTIRLHFHIKKPSGQDVLHLNIQEKSYENKTIIQNSSISIRRGDKIGLIGANGLGKSTLLRIINQKEPFIGSIQYGHNVIPAFFAQHQLEALNLKNTILQEFHDDIMEKGETVVRSILGGFLFTGDDVQKKIEVLSGGEKARVALAKTLLSNANFLLLDEPTNHLDLDSIEILVQALQDYEGTYVVVSHDRFFLERTTNKIWYIENQTLKEYPGNFKEFQEYQASQSGNNTLNAKPIPVTNKPSQNKNQSQNALSYEENKKIKNEIKKVEKLISQYELDLEHIKNQFVLPEVIVDFKKIEDYQKEQRNLESKLLELYEQLETLEKQLNI